MIGSDRQKTRHCARFHIPGGFTRDFRLNLPDAAAADVRGAEAELTRRKSIKTRHTEAVAKLCAIYRSLPIDDIREQPRTKIEGSNSKAGFSRLARLIELKKGGGGTERCLFGSSRLLEPCDFSLQFVMRSLISCTGRSSRLLSDLVRRRRLSWRRAENLIVISRPCKSPCFPAKARYSEYCITPHWEPSHVLLSQQPGLCLFRGSPL